MSLEKLSPDAVASGREHPFVMALERDIEARLTDLTGRLTENASFLALEGSAVLFQLGGRIAELKNLRRWIRHAGQEDANE